MTDKTNIIRRFLAGGMAVAMTALISHAEIALPDIISNNMVLQQQSDARLWGWSSPGAVITVIPGWDGRTYTVKADRNGRWDVAVATTDAGYTPHTLSISGDGSDIKLENILIGEVWF